MYHYTKYKESSVKFFRPQQGVTKGLTVMLDAHTDQVAKSTVYDSFQGFMAVINSRYTDPYLLPLI